MKKKIIFIVLLITVIVIIYLLETQKNIITLTKNHIPNNKKIALCISGREDNIEYCYNSWKKYLLSNNDVDIFIHINDCTDSVKKFIEDIIKPINVIYEDPILDNTNNWYPNMNIMFYRIYMCNLMKNEYSLNNNVNYDIVIRLRPDIVFYQQLTIDKFTDSNILYLPCYKILKIINVFNFAINDQLFLGSNKVMDKLCNFYINSNKYKNFKCGSPEIIFKNYILDHPTIFVKKFYLSFFLYEYLFIKNIPKFLSKIKYTLFLYRCY
jgi:hypothetical protein